MEPQYNSLGQFDIDSLFWLVDVIGQVELLRSHKLLEARACVQLDVAHLLLVDTILRVEVGQPLKEELLVEPDDAHRVA